ncbi:MAG: hypothetical protein MJZ16_14150, partial [Bacteroidales bacterium]|nr:hypothetical protein [Bacteroidales bacterium]
SLASPETIASMFASKDMDATQELQLFNSFVDALLDKDANLILSCSSPSYSDSLEVVKSFDISWRDHRRIVSQSSGRINAADTLGLVTSVSKTKVKTTAADYITGGSLWTFSNGMRVVFKQTSANKGYFSYGLLVRGGYAGISGLEREDERYVADLIALYDVGGLTEYNFTRMLDANGISMQSKVTPSALSLYGKAPSTTLNLLMKAILSISQERGINRQAFDYYVKSKGLSDEYLLSKDQTFQDLVEKYYADKLTNFADAELVIVGDIQEGVAKKILTKFMGGFNQQKSTLPRKVMEEVVSSGTTTQIEDLNKMPERALPSVNVTMTTAVPFTTDRLMSLYVAKSYLEKALSKELSAMGVYSEVDASFSLTPSEKFTMEIVCHPADESGLP